jgi:hypothetical protein
MNQNLNTGCTMHVPEENSEQRLSSDRRRCPTPLISTYSFRGGQRRAVRRELDRGKHILVDSYSPRLFITLLSLLILSLSDAYLTCILIKEYGYTEVNPVMAFYLESGEMLFIIEKFLFTSLSIFIFCLFNNFTITKISLASSITIYLIVIVYELNIMFKFFPYF